MDGYHNYVKRLIDYDLHILKIRKTSSIMDNFSKILSLFSPTFLVSNIEFNKKDFNL